MNKRAPNGEYQKPGKGEKPKYKKRTCMKEKSSKVLVLGEEEGDDEITDTDDCDDYENNREDHIYFTQKKEGTRPTGSKKTKGKKEKENDAEEAEIFKDKSNTEMLNIEEKKKKLTKLRMILKEIST